VPIDADPEVAAALEEVQRILDSPLSELMESEEERAATEELSRQALRVPAMTRLRALVAFVGGGRPATQAGNLKAADAVAVAVALDTRDAVSGEVRTMDDLPGVAHVFRWATAAGFLAKRGTKVVAGPWARDLERDPLAAWLKAATTQLEHGLLDGFRRGWRKRYVELMDAEVGELLAAMLEAGGAIPLGAIGDRVWGRVAVGYGFDMDDDAERRHVIQLVEAMVAQLTDIGMVTCDDDVVLTGLGSILATAAAAMASDDELDELDLVDTDAQSLLLVCADETEPADASDHLLAWCRARPADEAADELCQAMLDEEDHGVWRLGLEALGMLEPAVAESAIRRLRSHPGLRAEIAEWQRRHGRARSPGKPS